MATGPSMFRSGGKKREDLLHWLLCQRAPLSYANGGAAWENPLLVFPKDASPTHSPGKNPRQRKPRLVQLYHTKTHSHIFDFSVQFLIYQFPVEQYDVKAKIATEQYNHQLW